MSPLVLPGDNAQLLYSDELKGDLDNRLSRLCKGDPACWGGGSVWTSWPWRPLAMLKTGGILWGPSDQKGSLKTQRRALSAGRHSWEAVLVSQRPGYLGLELQQHVLCCIHLSVHYFTLPFSNPKPPLWEHLSTSSSCSLLPASGWSVCVCVFVCVWFFWVMMKIPYSCI